MSRTLGIVVLTLAASRPAFAANNSVINYTLQLGGSNAGGPTVPFDTTDVKEAGETPIFAMPFGMDVVTWSVRVSVSGDVDGVPVGGAANLVWDLALRDSTGALVGGGVFDTDGGFGICTDWSEAGFFNSIMNVETGGPYARQPACFTWVFDVNGLGAGQPHGRLIDAVTANGPNMAQFSYPSTYRYARYPGAATPADPSLVLAPSGTLMGMGAGYVNLDPTDGLERAGVGILSSGDGYYTCYQSIGAKVPIAEGQINMRGLPYGTYSLVLTPDLGNNVVSTSLCAGGTEGAFAARAGTATGSTIQFWYQPESPPVPILLPGVASVKYHGGLVYGIPFIGDGVRNPGGWTSTSVECRAGGVTQILLPFDMAVEAADGTLDGNEIAVTGGTVTSLDATTPGLILVNMTTTNQNGSCVKVTVSGLRHAGSGAGGAVSDTVTKSIIVLRGDVNGSGCVDIGDINTIKAATNPMLNASAVMFRRDVTANGAIDIGDVNNVKSLSGNCFTGTCP